jgi:hypothetical protein
MTHAKTAGRTAEHCTSDVNELRPTLIQAVREVRVGRDSHRAVLLAVELTCSGALAASPLVAIVSAAERGGADDRSHGFGATVVIGAVAGSETSFGLQRLEQGRARA